MAFPLGDDKISFSVHCSRDLNEHIQEMLASNGEVTLDIGFDDDGVVCVYGYGPWKTPGIGSV